MRNPVNDDKCLADLRELVLRRLPSGSASDSVRRISVYIEESSFIRPGYENIPFNNGDMWADESDRAKSRFMHGFVFFNGWPKSILEDLTGHLAWTAMSIVLEWHSRYSSIVCSNDMAYHDETTAQRMINLLAVREACTPHLPGGSIDFLEVLINETADLLADENFHSTGNNHGMFQDLALINYSVLATWIDTSARLRLFNLGERRIRRYFMDCFTREGVHRENTPTYHLMICHQLKSHCELLNSMSHPGVQTLSDLLDAASTFATHSIMPSGTFPPVSDTTQMSLDWHSRNLFDDSEFKFAASRGRIGTRPKKRTLVLPESGYAIYRSSWTDSSATFAYFHAAYNADYHKHSDDLSFLLSSCGIDLLTEAGPHGYNYNDPMTVFAYGQYAHNNIVVNRKSVRRTDDRAQTVMLISNYEREDGFSVTGSTGRLHDTEHHRTVDVFEEDGQTKIDVLDVVVSNSENQYDLVWNIGPQVVPVRREHGFELSFEGGKILDAFMTADVPFKVSLHRGETKPVRLGWRCPSFGVSEPSNVVVSSFNAKSASIVTKFRLKKFN